MEVSNDTSVLLENLEEEIVFANLPNVVIVSFFIIFGSAGNAFVLYIYCISMKKKRTNQYFIPYLAWVDMASCLVNGSLEITFDLVPLSFSDDVGCKFIRFFGNVLSILSGILLLVIAVQRFLLVCRPLAQQPSTNMKRFIVFVVTSFTIIISAPKFLFTGAMAIDTRYANVSGVVCGLNEKFEGTTSLIIYNLILILTAVACLITLSVLYILIVRAIYKRNKKLNKMKQRTAVSESSKSDAEMSTLTTTSQTNENSIRSPESQDMPRRPSSSDANSRKTSIAKLGASQIKKTLSNHRFSWMFLTITVLSIVSYAPRMTIENMEAGNKNYAKDFTASQRTTLGFLECLYLLNNIVNPLIYGLFDRKFRELWIKTICRR